MGYGRHLRQRGGANHFRRVVPKDLVVRLGRREIVRSIGVLPSFERHSASRRFSLACDEVFRMVRSEPSLTREEIDRLVAVYLGDLAKRDQEYASWLPRRPLDEAEFHRRAQITTYADLARSVADARRTKARVIDEDMLATVADKAGVTFDFEGPDAFRVEDALTEALARFYGQRADELRSERRIGQSGGVGQFIRDLLGIAVPRVSSHSASVRAPAHVQPSEDAEHVSMSFEDVEAVGRTVDEELPAPQPGFGRPTRVSAEAAGGLDEGEAAAERSIEHRGQDLFSALWDSFVYTKVSLRREWKPSRRPELLGTSRLWVWIVGDLPVGDYTSQHVRTFRDAYVILHRRGPPARHAVID